MHTRERAIELFRTALEAVRVGARIDAHVSCDGNTLRIDDREFALASYRRIGLIAMGKAAYTMSSAFLRRLGGGASIDTKLSGIVVAPSMPAEPHASLSYVTGGHPLPTRSSIRAAELILEFLAEINTEDLVVFLISGGASAMVERALDACFTLQHTIELYRALLHSGLSIDQMNCVRKHLSAVKGGRLALAANGATQISLLISDVPGDDPSVIGSGPSVPDGSTLEDCRCFLGLVADRVPVTPSLSATLASVPLEETPKPNHPGFARCFWTCVLRPADLLEAAVEEARRAGFYTVIDNTCDDWECMDAAVYLISRIRALRARHERICLLSSGELSVRLPAQHGVGGRNQHFALACALQLQEAHEHVTVLSAGSDGVDGNSPAAGAIANETTCHRARKQGLNPRNFFNDFDSFTLFRNIGDTVVTGPTENNLRDLRILMSERSLA